MHTVGRRAVDITKAIAGPLNIQRRMQGQGIRFGTVVVLGCYHLDLGNLLDRLIKRRNAWRLKTVVVANQNFHETTCNLWIVGGT